MNLGAVVKRIDDGRLLVNYFKRSDTTNGNKREWVPQEDLHKTYEEHILLYDFAVEYISFNNYRAIRCCSNDETVCLIEDKFKKICSR